MSSPTLSKYHKQKIFNILPTFRQAVKSFSNSHLSTNLDCHHQKDLKCSCAISSHAMGTLLEKMGYQPTIVLGVYNEENLETITPNDVNHCWIELGGYIIDVTATQFGIPDEILFEKIEDAGEKFIPLIRTNVKDMKSDVTDWPKRQTPSLRNTKHILRSYQDLTGEDFGV